MRTKLALLLAAIVVAFRLYFFLGMAYTKGSEATCNQVDGRWIPGEDYCEVHK